MPKRNVATNYTFEQQRQEINLIAADLWDGVLGGASTDFSTVVGWGDHNQAGYLKADGTVSTTAAFTFGNKIIGPSTFTIEPTNVNGTVVIAGNLQVDGTQTAVNSTTMDVTDLNITVAKGAANAAAADTAGITVDGANATLQYEDGSPGTWESSLGFRLDGKHGSAGLALDLAGSADYLIRESTTDDIVQFGGTGSANFFKSLSAVPPLFSPLPASILFCLASLRFSISFTLVLFKASNLVEAPSLLAPLMSNLAPRSSVTYSSFIFLLGSVETLVGFAAPDFCG